MTSKVFLVDKENGLQSLVQFPYEEEKQLDYYVETYPQLLASALSLDDEELKFILVEAQPKIDEAGGGKPKRWKPDAVFLDQKGILTIVEDKLSKNAEIRRRIVAQMIEYTANILSTENAVSLEGRLVKTHADLDELLSNLLSESDGETEGVTALFWSNVQRNLEAGRCRMVFVADNLPSELRIMIEFLNTYMSPMDVLGVEIQRLHDNTKESGMEVLATSTFGVSERKTVKSTVTGSKGRTQSSEEEYIEKLESMKDDSPQGKAAKQTYYELVKCPDLQPEYYQTPSSQTTSAFRRKGDNLLLWQVRAEYKEGKQQRCNACVSPRGRDKWTEPLIKDLESILGFALPDNGLGHEILPWCSKSEANTRKLIEFIKEAASDK